MRTRISDIEPGMLRALASVHLEIPRCIKEANLATSPSPETVTLPPRQRTPPRRYMDEEVVFHRRPPGRAPVGKCWDPIGKQWVPNSPSVLDALVEKNLAAEKKKKAPTKMAGNVKGKKRKSSLTRRSLSSSQSSTSRSSAKGTKRPRGKARKNSTLQSSLSHEASSNVSLSTKDRLSTLPPPRDSLEGDRMTVGLGNTSVGSKSTSPLNPKTKRMQTENIVNGDGTSATMTTPPQMPSPKRLDLRLGCNLASDSTPPSTVKMRRNGSGLLAPLENGDNKTVERRKRTPLKKSGDALAALWSKPEDKRGNGVRTEASTAAKPKSRVPKQKATMPKAETTIIQGMEKLQQHGGLLARISFSTSRKRSRAKPSLEPNPAKKVRRSAGSLKKAPSQPEYRESKRPLTQLGDGTFARPVGKAPQGYDWEKVSGAWRSTGSAAAETKVGEKTRTNDTNLNAKTSSATESNRQRIDSSAESAASSQVHHNASAPPEDRVETGTEESTVEFDAEHGVSSPMKDEDFAGQVADEKIVTCNSKGAGEDGLSQPQKNTRPAEKARDRGGLRTASDKSEDKMGPSKDILQDRNASSMISKTNQTFDGMKRHLVQLADGCFAKPQGTDPKGYRWDKFTGVWVRKLYKADDRSARDQQGSTGQSDEVLQAVEKLTKGTGEEGMESSQTRKKKSFEQRKEMPGQNKRGQQQVTVNSSIRGGPSCTSARNQPHGSSTSTRTIRSPKPHSSPSVSFEPTSSSSTTRCSPTKRRQTRQLRRSSLSQSQPPHSSLSRQRTGRNSIPDGRDFVACGDCLNCRLPTNCGACLLCKNGLHFGSLFPACVRRICFAPVLPPLQRFLIETTKKEGKKSTSKSSLLSNAARGLTAKDRDELSEPDASRASIQTEDMTDAIESLHRDSEDDEMSDL